jgi:hypothetical protein
VSETFCKCATLEMLRSIAERYATPAPAKRELRDAAKALLKFGTLGDHWHHDDCEFCSALEQLRRALAQEESE